MIFDKIYIGADWFSSKSVEELYTYSDGHKIKPSYDFCTGNLCGNHSDIQRRKKSQLRQYHHTQYINILSSKDCEKYPIPINKSNFEDVLRKIESGHDNKLNICRNRILKSKITSFEMCFNIFHERNKEVFNKLQFLKSPHLTHKTINSNEGITQCTNSRSLVFYMRDFGERKYLRIDKRFKTKRSIESYFNRELEVNDLLDVEFQVSLFKRVLLDLSIEPGCEQYFGGL